MASANAFAVDLYGRLAAKSGNLFFSPESIEVALALAYAGARGTTAEQMAKVLHFPANDETPLKELGASLAELNAEKTARDYQLSLANSIWAQKGETFLPAFLDLLKTDFGATPAEVDYEHDAEGARRTINAWVEEKTHDKIKDLIARGVLASSTRLVLANAIYFKGTWETPFAKSDTREEAFHASGEEKAPMMHHSGSYAYFENDELQALELPYAGGELSMVIFLPRKPDGLPALEKSITAESLASWTEGAARRTVEVTLPKFTTTAQFELSEQLSALGMGAAFSREADFSGMTGHKDLQIGAVIHKAFVAVNEEGAEAAAATAVGMTAMAMPMPMPPVVFRADHPFLYVIRHEKSGAILFMGRLASTGRDGPARTP